MNTSIQTSPELETARETLQFHRDNLDRLRAGLRTLDEEASQLRSRVFVLTNDPDYSRQQLAFNKVSDRHRKDWSEGKMSLAQADVNAFKEAEETDLAIVVEVMNAEARIHEIRFVPSNQQCSRAKRELFAEISHHFHAEISAGVTVRHLEGLI